MKQNEKYFGDIEGLVIYFDDILVAAESIEHSKLPIWKSEKFN